MDPLFTEGPSGVMAVDRAHAGAVTLMRLVFRNSSI